MAVQLKGARVEWEEGKAALEGVDLTALVGDLVAVVGPVGAGLPSKVDEFIPHTQAVDLRIVRKPVGGG